MFLQRLNSRRLQKTDLEHQEAKVSELRAAIGPLSGRSLKYCTDGCLRRYLEARDWNVDKARKVLEETLKWRSTYKPEEIRWHEVAHEAESGTISIANFRDLQGRTVLIMRPGKQRNTISGEDKVRYLVYLLESAIHNLPEGQAQMTWLVDYTGWTLNTNITLKTIRDIIHTIQNHYPERVAVSILYNPSRFFESIWKVAKYFMDSKFHEKVKFVYLKDKHSAELMRSLFDAENLPLEFGGKATLNYDHEEFSKLMVENDLKTAEFWGL